jgi:hypothetical protein
MIVRALSLRGAWLLYRSGRAEAWLKIKTMQALYLRRRKGKKLIYMAKSSRTISSSI